MALTKKNKDGTTSPSYLGAISKGVTSAFGKDSLIPGYMKRKMMESPVGKLGKVMSRGTPSYKKGGKVKKTGLAKLHRGERVLAKKQSKKFSLTKFEKARKSHYKLS